MNQHTPPQGAWGPGQQPPAAPPAPQPHPSGFSNDDRLIAAAAHGLSFIEGGLLGPFVIYLLKKNESDFVAFHALQSLLFGLAFFALSAVTCGFGAIVLVWPYLIFEAIATLKAYEGEWYELPIVGRYAREKHPGPGGVPAPASF